MEQLTDEQLKICLNHIMNEHSVEGYQIIDELAEKDPMVKIIGKSQVLLNIYIQLYREGSKRFLKLV